MQIGTSLLLIAAGAILRFAVTAEVEGFSIQTAGTVLLVVGIVGLVISLFWMTVLSDRRRHEPDDLPDTRPARERYPR
jgi:Co/Zn/Cd efflux system component